MNREQARSCNSRLWCIAALAACIAGTAFAQATSDYLARMDTDRDARVSLGEYQDWMSYAFDAMDHDHDGVLSPAEQPGGRGRLITRAARMADIARLFRIQDRNGDGFLDARELAMPPR